MARKPVRWKVDTIDASSNGIVKVYNCNTIIFENRTGGSDIIIINGGWILYPGWLPIYLKCLDGEVDEGSYLIQFANASTSTSVLQIMYKE